MAERRTQSYAAVPRTIMPVAERVEFIETDPDDFEPELPPSPMFWPRDEPKESPRR
jgi:hypothetical protein